MDLYQKCINIFYNYIIEEASLGKIESYFRYNLIFNTKIEGKDIYHADDYYHDLLIPTLNIKKKNEFDELLVLYVYKCLNFYVNWPSEIEDNNLYIENGTSKEKTIMSLLFANATVDDFNNPNNFIRKRIDFMDSVSCQKITLGYFEEFRSFLDMEIKKDIINNETPFKFVITATDDNNLKYVFPEIKFGISDNNLYVYAIQRKSNSENSLSKRINRLLYKINSGIDLEKDNFSVFALGNLKDITPSFVVAINFLITYFYNVGIRNIILPSILLERWNAKKIANYLKFKAGKTNFTSLEELDMEQNFIQKNLTEKFIRTFLRLQYHYPGISISSYPFEGDASMHFKINNLYNCNNLLLNKINLFISQNYSDVCVKHNGK